MKRVLLLQLWCCSAVLARSVERPAESLAASSKSNTANDENHRYQFRYRVSEETTGDFKAQSESRDNAGVITGMYRFLQPDGCVRVVHYTADEKGFHPTVTYEGDCQQRGSISPSQTQVESDGSSFTSSFLSRPVYSAVPGLNNLPAETLPVEIERPSQTAVADGNVASEKFILPSITNLLQNFNKPIIPSASTPVKSPATITQPSATASINQENAPANTETEFAVPSSVQGSVKTSPDAVPDSILLLLNSFNPDSSALSKRSGFVETESLDAEASEIQVSQAEPDSIRSLDVAEEQNNEETGDVVLAGDPSERSIGSFVSSAFAQVQNLTAQVGNLVQKPIVSLFQSISNNKPATTTTAQDAVAAPVNNDLVTKDMEKVDVAFVDATALEEAPQQDAAAPFEIHAEVQKVEIKEAETIEVKSAETAEAVGIKKEVDTTAPEVKSAETAETAGTQETAAEIIKEVETSPDVKSMGTAETAETAETQEASIEIKKEVETPELKTAELHAEEKIAIETEQNQQEEHIAETHVAIESEPVATAPDASLDNLEHPIEHHVIVGNIASAVQEIAAPIEETVAIEVNDPSTIITDEPVPVEVQPEESVLVADEPVVEASHVILDHIAPVEPEAHHELTSDLREAEEPLPIDNQRFTINEEVFQQEQASSPVQQFLPAGTVFYSTPLEAGPFIVRRTSLDTAYGVAPAPSIRQEAARAVPYGMRAVVPNTYRQVANSAPRQVQKGRQPLRQAVPQQAAYGRRYAAVRTPPTNAHYAFHSVPYYNSYY